MCSDFTEHGSCSRGQNCQFSHGQQELRQAGGHGQDRSVVDKGQSLESTKVFELVDDNIVAPDAIVQIPLQTAACCNGACIDQEINQKLRTKLLEIKVKSSTERKQFLLDHLVKQEELDIPERSANNGISI